MSNPLDEAEVFIPLTRGYVTVVRWSQFEKIRHYNYHASRSDKNGYRIYACRNGSIKNGLKRKMISLHREILNAEKGVDVDHINGNTLDNRTENLRLCTRSQNLQNRIKIRNSNQKYKGIYFANGKWIARAGAGSKFKLGRFKSEIEAAKAYDDFVTKTYGSFAKINFPKEDK